jgi:hypothetical protein
VQDHVAGGTARAWTLNVFDRERAIT